MIVADRLLVLPQLAIDLGPKGPAAGALGRGLNHPFGVVQRGDRLFFLQKFFRQRLVDRQRVVQGAFGLGQLGEQLNRVALRAACPERFGVVPPRGQVGFVPFGRLDELLFGRIVLLALERRDPLTIQFKLFRDVPFGRERHQPAARQNNDGAAPPRGPIEGRGGQSRFSFRAGHRLGPVLLQCLRFFAGCELQSFPTCARGSIPFSGHRRQRDFSRSLL